MLPIHGVCTSRVGISCVGSAVSFYRKHAAASENGVPMKNSFGRRIYTCSRLFAFHDLCSCRCRLLHTAPCYCACLLPGHLTAGLSAVFLWRKACGISRRYLLLAVRPLWCLLRGLIEGETIEGRPSGLCLWPHMASCPGRLP